MASPDITPFIDLRLIDKDPQDLFDAALLNLSVNMPEWVAREGNVEVLLLEAFAIEVAEAVFAINRLVSSVVEVLLSMYDIPRDNGQPPTAEIRFEMAGTQGYTIPAGTPVRLEPENFDAVIFSTDAELVIPQGSSSGVVTATGDRFTSDVNGYAADTTLVLMESIVSVNYARLNDVPTGGRDPEDDFEFLARGVQRFQRLSSTLVLPSHFTAAALERSAVERAYTLDNYNPDAPASVPVNGVGTDYGHITVAMYGDNEALDAAEKALFLAESEELALANLVVHVIDPTITPVNVTANVRIEQGADPAVVTADVREALREYLNPMTWGWGKIVRRNELISLVTNVPGVDYVDNFSIPATDLTLAGVAPLATAGTLTIGVAS